MLVTKTFVRLRALRGSFAFVLQVFKLARYPRFTPASAASNGSARAAKNQLATSGLPSLPYNTSMPIPGEIQGQKYLSLTTFRKNGAAVPTPVWFGEGDGRLYVMTRSDSGKYKRLRNNPQVQIAPCTVRGKITGPRFTATVRILPPQDWPHARKTIARKYWLARVPFLWSKQNVYLEIDDIRI